MECRRLERQRSGRAAGGSTLECTYTVSTTASVATYSAANSGCARATAPPVTRFRAAYTYTKPAGYTSGPARTLRDDAGPHGCS